jgi:hypothetical protein
MVQKDQNKGFYLFSIIGGLLYFISTQPFGSAKFAVAAGQIVSVIFLPTGRRTGGHRQTMNRTIPDRYSKALQPA